MCVCICCLTQQLDVPWCTPEKIDEFRSQKLHYLHFLVMNISIFSRLYQSIVILAAIATGSAGWAAFSCRSRESRAAPVTCRTSAPFATWTWSMTGRGYGICNQLQVCFAGRWEIQAPIYGNPNRKNMNTRFQNTGFRGILLSDKPI